MGTVEVPAADGAKEAKTSALGRIASKVRASRRVLAGTCQKRRWFAAGIEAMDILGSRPATRS